MHVQERFHPGEQFIFPLACHFPFTALQMDSECIDYIITLNEDGQTSKGSELKCTWTFRFGLESELTLTDV